MRYQALSLLSVFTGIAFAAGPHVFTDTARGPLFWVSRQATFILDGPAFHTFITPQPDPSVVALYEVYNRGNLNHLYTTDIAEVDRLEVRGDTNCFFEGRNDCELWNRGTLDIYIYNQDGPGRTPLHRFFNGQFHFFSTDLNEGLVAGYVHEGVAGWVLPGPVSGSTQYYRWRKA